MKSQKPVIMIETLFARMPQNMMVLIDPKNMKTADILEID